MGSSASVARSWPAAPSAAVDAFFAPVAFRIQSYNLILDTASAAYARGLLELRSMQAWYRRGARGNDAR